MKGSRFIIFADGLLKPSSVTEHKKDETGFCRVRIQIIDGEFQNSKVEQRFQGNLPTCSPSFVYYGELRVTEYRNIHTYYVKDKKHPIRVELLDKKGMLERDDLRYMVKELGTVRKQVIDQILHECPVHVSVFRLKPFFVEQNMEYACDYFRYAHERVLQTLFPKQLSVIRKLNEQDLQTLEKCLVTDPWMLCTSSLCKRFDLKPLEYQVMEGYCESQGIVTDEQVMRSIRLYSYMWFLRSSGHTKFDMPGVIQAYLMTRQFSSYQDTKEQLEAVVALLGNYYIKHQGNVYGFDDDWSYCDSICQYLTELEGEPALRQGPVPCRPKGELTDTQKQFMHHVMHLPLTLLIGGPGTGKSECLVACMAYFERPLVVTYVGMMVDALQKRFGNHSGTVHTIHSIHYARLMQLQDSPYAKQLGAWLQEFDVVIVDECANVDTRLLYRLLTAATGARRLILAGDVGQINPMKPGSPFRDLIARFPQHVFELKENKRVDPDARVLADASAYLHRNDRQLMRMLQGDTLTLVQDHSDEKLEELVMQYATQDLMKFQIIVLRNVDRQHCNKIMEQTLLKYHILRMGSKVITITGSDGKVELFVGKKITFNLNIRGHEDYDDVRNGELGIIREIQILEANQSWVLTLHNGKRVLLGHNEPAVPCRFVSAGYATTCNKAQGSEWDYIVFWVYPEPTNMFTREYPYVAVSRAKKKCTIVARYRDFQALCAREAQPRFTLLSHCLAMDNLLGASWRVPEEMNVPDFHTQTLLPAGSAVVPQRPKPDSANSNTKKTWKKQKKK